MSSPITPNPPTGPTTPLSQNVGSPTQPVPIDVSTKALGQIVLPPSFDAGLPQLSMMAYYGAISEAGVAQQAQQYLDQMTDPSFRKKQMAFAAEMAAYVQKLIATVFKYETFRSALDKLGLSQKATNINQSLAAYGGTTGDNAAIKQLDDAIAAFNNAKTTYQAALKANPPGTPGYDKAVADYNQAVATYKGAVTTYNTYVASRSTAFQKLSKDIDAWNQSLASAATSIAKMNEIRASLGLAPISGLSGISSYTGLTSMDSLNLDPNVQISPLAYLTSIPTKITIGVPPKDDMITGYLQPHLAVLESLRVQSQDETYFREEVTNSPAEKNKEPPPSPLLNTVLAQQSLEAILNAYQVPTGSSLVDRLGALFVKIQTQAGLTSAGVAHSILTHAVLTEASGKAALDTAVALGNISVVNEANLLELVKKSIGNDPSLAHLNPAQKNAFLESVAEELGASLNKAALNELARALKLPGLLPQILTLASGSSTNDPSQLYKLTVLEPELAKTFQISSDEAHQLIQTALNTEKPVEDAIKDALIKKGINANEVEQKMQIVLNATENQIKVASQNADLEKRDAFRASILKSLTDDQVDPVKANQIADKISIGTLEETKNFLTKNGIGEKDAANAAEAAVSAANQKDPRGNPLSSPLVLQYGSSSELASLLKGQIVNALSPAVGMRAALSVAENYGSLIFSSANSITNILSANEKHVRELGNFTYDARLYENYLSATESYTNPQLAIDSPLHLGKTLLLSGIPGGLSNQGLTSADNTLGPSANQSKHATTYPGILG